MVRRISGEGGVPQGYPGTRLAHFDKSAGGEAALAFALLAADTAIGAIQSSRIANAETRAAAANLEAGRLGVDVQNLRGFVSGREREIAAQFDRFKKFAADETAKTSVAISDLNAAKNQLNQSRNDAVAAAQSAKADLATMIASLKQEEQVLEQEKLALAPRGLNQAQQDDFVEKTKGFAGLTANVLRRRLIPLTLGRSRKCFLNF